MTQFGKPDYNNPQVIEHQKSFEEWLFSKFIKKATSFVLSKNEIDDIIEVLKGTKIVENANKK